MFWQSIYEIKLKEKKTTADTYVDYIIIIQPRQCLLKNSKFIVMNCIKFKPLKSEQIL